MVTRSQAKRRAEEQLVSGSEKWSRLCSEGNNEAEGPPSRPEVKYNGELDDKEETSEGPAERDPGQNDLPPEIAQARPEESETPGDPNTAQDGLPPGITQTRPKQSEDALDDGEEKKRIMERGGARAVIRPLQLLIERCRISGSDMPAPILEQQRLAVTELCEVTAQADMRLNSNPSILPNPWWRRMRELREALRQTDEMKERLNNFTAEMLTCSAGYDDAVATRNGAFVGIGDRSEKVRQDNDENAAKAGEALAKACKSVELAERQLQEAVQAEQGLIDAVLQLAEPALVEDGLLPERIDAAVLSRRDGEGSAKDRTSSRSVRRSAERRSQSHRRSSCADQDRQHRRPTGASDDGSDEQRRVDTQESSEEPAAAIHLVKDAQASQRERLKAAKRAWSIASVQFHNTREKYHCDYWDLLDTNNGDLTKDTRHDFDRLYFLTRNQTNYNLARAEED